MPSHKDCVEIVMRNIDFKAFKNYVKSLSGKTFQTSKQKKNFIVQFKKGKIHYIPKATGKPRPHEDIYLERVVDRFNETNSLMPKDYVDITLNASYTLALIEQYIVGKNTNDKIWRMAFRCGIQGPSLWRECKEHKVAAISYAPLANVDLSKYPREEPDKLWRQLFPTQRSSLRHVAYDMKKGDTIYVKEGTLLVSRGTVNGSYEFHRDSHVIDVNGDRWPHQIPVDWETDFVPVNILLGAESITVLELDGARLEKLESVLCIDSVVKDDLDSLSEEETFAEGDKKTGFVNYYERNQSLRTAAIGIHGTICKACRFNFGEKYGEHGEDYIEVHHLRPVRTLTKKVNINAKKDMTVLCSNCHRMIHRKKNDILSIEELKRLITTGGSH